MKQGQQYLPATNYKLQTVHAFTLLELLIALTIIIIIIGVVSLILKPQQILQNSRDTQRLTELANLQRAIGIALGQNPLIITGSSSVVYLSLPDTSADCTGWLPQLPTLPANWSYHCSPASDYKKGDSTGWLPINFSSITSLNLDSLIVDPNNQPPYYFTYVTGGNTNQVSGGGFEFTAALESQKNRGPSSKSATDGGTNDYVYEIGDSLQLTPAAIEARATSTNP